VCRWERGELVSLLELERKEAAAQRGILEHTTTTAQADRSHTYRYFLVE
jgi:hypothetical protein